VRCGGSKHGNQFGDLGDARIRAQRRSEQIGVERKNLGLAMNIGQKLQETR
jgi:hypothetical protein